MSPSKGISGFDSNTDSTAPKQRRNRLLLIGIDQYEHWGKLQYPVSDCNQFFGLLKEHYGLGEQDLIQSLFNEQATADIIFDELYRLQERDEDGKPRLGPDDNLILYFSGHGHLDKSLDEGYWAPVDAPVPVKNRPSDLRKLVSVSEVVKILSQVKAHHILLIVDACFSGAFARMAVEVMPSGDPNNPEEKPSRWVLTAGRLETVPDKSDFAEALRQVLEANDSPKISIDWVGAELAKKVRENTRYNPWCGTLVEKKYEGGEFFFHRSTAVQRTDHAPRPAAAIAQLPERLRQGSAAHLERLKKGRFKHLNIIQLLLTGHKLPDLIDTQVKSGDTETPLQQAVQSLWGREKPHAVVLGDGGMGKTVSLVRLWEDMLTEPPSNVHRLPSTVPVFVALNEYNAVPDNEKHDFVLRSIARNCGLVEALTDDWKNALWELLKTPIPNPAPAISSLVPHPSSLPSVLLMLDGFNEVTVKKDQLLIDLNRLSEQAKGMQMVITSRYVEIQNFTWAQHSEVVELLPLPPVKIEAYLQQVNLPLPEDEALQKLFGNPMMLTLYAGASSIAKKYEHDKRFRFLPTGSYGELLWNFNEAQLARHLEDLEHDPDEQAWHCFLLRCLVPRLAYKMELEGQFFVPTRKALNPAFNFKTLLDEAFTDLNREELTEVFPELNGRRSLLGLGELSDLDAREQRSQKVLRYLIDKLHLLVAEDEALRFVHQNFRDFFAAVHLRNVAEMALVRGGLPEEWKVRAFPVYLRRMIGEMEGERHFDPKNAATGEPMPGFVENSTLARLLDACRGIFDDETVRYVVWNIVKTIADVRDTLAGMNLEWLDLRMVYLNGIPLSHHLGNYQYLSTRLKGSLFKGKQLISQGHSGALLSICYSPDGRKVLSGGEGLGVREWLLETGECLQILRGRPGTTFLVCYSRNGEKLLRSSLSIEEFSNLTGSLLQTFRNEKTFFIFAGYNFDEDKIISIDDDNYLQVWSVNSGICLKKIKINTDVINKACLSNDRRKLLLSTNDTITTWSTDNWMRLLSLEFNDYQVTSICYSPDGKKILAGFSDSTIKEWSSESGKHLETFVGHSGPVSCVCYSKDGKKILSGASDGEVIEWSVISGYRIKTFSIHSSAVNLLLYHPNEKKFLSSSFKTETIEEWDNESGECLQILRGAYAGHTTACYCKSRKKILTASEEGTVKEWSTITGTCLQILSGHKNAVNMACYSPDGSKVLSASNDGTIKEWLVETGECIQTFDESPKGINSAFYDSIGKKILSTSNDHIIKEWSTETGVCQQIIDGRDHKVLSARYRYNSDEVIYALDRDTILEWSKETGVYFRIIAGDRIDLARPRITGSGRLTTRGEAFLEATYGYNLSEITADNIVINTFDDEPGLLIQSCDLKNLNKDSQINEEEKDRLRRYGAIFSDEDERRWKEAVADAYGDMDDDEPENPLQP